MGVTQRRSGVVLTTSKRIHAKHRIW